MFRYAIPFLTSSNRQPERSERRASGLLRTAAHTLMALALLSTAANAEYPEKVIKIIVPFASGGGTDIIARTLAQDMSPDLGKPIIIENKPGGGTIIGTQAAAMSDPDGYSLLLATFAHAVNPSLVSKLPFDARKDFAPVSLIARSFNIVVVNKNSKINSIADLIAEAKAKPDAINYGTFGVGTSAHLAGELFKSMAKVNMTAVAYKGSAPAITDLLGGQIQVMFTTVASASSLIESGQLRALAVTSAERSSAFPNLPTVAEAGVPDYVAESWYGLYAPAKTPRPIVDRLNQALTKAVNSSAFKRLEKNDGLIMVASSPEDLNSYVEGEMQRWSKVITESNIKPE